MEIAFTVLGFAIIAAIIFWAIYRKRPVYKVPVPFPKEWQSLLQTHIHFYQNLNSKEKRQFESDVRYFLESVRITGVRVKVQDVDRLLVAASAVIPLFGFPTWKYDYLHEVLLYPAHFDKNFSIDDPKEIILGMVGNGNMEGKMILSQRSLRQGFADSKDKQNVGIHEFVHILDKQDGSVDGIPGILNDEAYTTPWLKLMHYEMTRIKEGKSDINPYAATGEEEFLAVASEYFFEQPARLKNKHPELYRIMRKMYHQNMVRRLRKPFIKKKHTGRNDPCPCGSGQKFKECCLHN